MLPPAVIREGSMIRWRTVLLGFVVFVAAHVVEVYAWNQWFHPDVAVSPWFLNSGRAVAFTAAALFFATVATRALQANSPDTILALGVNAAAGAIAGMLIVMVASIRGTLFPIVFVVGALVCTAAAIAGVAVGAVVSWGKSRS